MGKIKFACNKKKNLKKIQNSIVKRKVAKDTDNPMKLSRAICTFKPEASSMWRKPVPGRRVHPPTVSTLVSVNMRKKLTPFPEPTALAYALIVSSERVDLAGCAKTFV